MRSTFSITTVCVDKFSFVHLRKTFVLFFPGHHRTQKEEMLTELVFGLSALLSGLQTASSSITTGEYECRIQGHGSPSLLSTRVLLQCPRSSRTLKKDTKETLGQQDAEVWEHCLVPLESQPSSCCLQDFHWARAAHGQLPNANSSPLLFHLRCFFRSIVKQDWRWLVLLSEMICISRIL